MLQEPCSPRDSHRTKGDAPLEVGHAGANRCAADLCHSCVGESQEGLLDRPWTSVDVLVSHSRELDQDTRDLNKDRKKGTVFQGAWEQTSEWREKQVTKCTWL